MKIKVIYKNISNACPLIFVYKGYKFGVNSEHIIHAIQTKVIHDVIGDRGFKNQSWNWKNYFQYKTPNKFTSW